MKTETESQIVNEAEVIANPGPLARLGARIDGWVNPFTGFGTARDRTTHSTYQTDAPLDEVELAALYHNNGFAKNIIESVPETALSLGVKVESEDNKAERIVSDMLGALGALEALKMGAIWGRCFGGGAILLGADDGRPSYEPLDVRKVRSFDFLRVYDRRDISVAEWDRNSAGDPRVYYLNGSAGSYGAVHRSRLILFGGAPTARREKEMLGGWDYSILQSCYESLKQAGSVYNGTHLMVSDAAQGVFKMRGLLSAIAGKQFELLMARMQLLDMSRSVARSIMLDAEGGEEFRKEQTAFSGIPDTIDKFVNKLAADSKTPVTVLMGQAPAGLNATGESDLRIWYGNVEKERTYKFLPALQRIVVLVRAAENVKANVSLSFPSLWQMTPKEEAELRGTVADTDVKYIQNGVVMPETIARNRFGGREWSAETRMTAEELEDFPSGDNDPGEAAVYGRDSDA